MRIKKKTIPVKKDEFKIINDNIIKVEGYTFDFGELNVRDATIHDLCSVSSDEAGYVTMEKETAEKIIHFLETEDEEEKLEEKIKKLKKKRGTLKKTLEGFMSRWAETTKDIPGFDSILFTTNGEGHYLETGEEYLKRERGENCFSDYIEINKLDIEELILFSENIQEAIKDIKKKIHEQTNKIHEQTNKIDKQIK